MTEWEVVGVIVVIVGLVGTFVKAAVSMTKSVQRNADATDRLSDVLRSFKDSNEKDHDKFDEKIEDHEHRITVLEHK